MLCAKKDHSDFVLLSTGQHSKWNEKEGQINDAPPGLHTERNKGTSYAYQLNFPFQITGSTLALKIYIFPVGHSKCWFHQHRQADYNM